jgi:predicted RND superfamily exporter protein
MFAHIGQRNINSMLSGTVTAEVLIALVLIFAVRSLKIGLISVIPNVVPILMAFGLWGILVGQVGMALAVVASMTLGIIVDDTVHFLTHYLKARRNQRLEAAEAVVHALSAVGPASMVTGLVLMAGFSVLAASSYEINRGMGMLTAIAIGFATVAEFLLLPPLLILIDRARAPATRRELARVPIVADDL